MIRLIDKEKLANSIKVNGEYRERDTRFSLIHNEINVSNIFIFKYTETKRRFYCYGAELGDNEAEARLLFEMVYYNHNKKSVETYAYKGKKDTR